MVQRFPSEFNPGRSWLPNAQSPVMPHGPYQGRRIDEIDDYAELRKWTVFPFVDLLDDAQVRAIERRLRTVSPEAYEGADLPPAEFVERCREAARRAKEGR